MRVKFQLRQSFLVLSRSWKSRKWLRLVLEAFERGKYSTLVNLTPSFHSINVIVFRKETLSVPIPCFLT